MKEQIFDTSKSDNLEEILYKARNTIVKNRLRVNYLTIVLSKKSRENNEDIEISTSFQVVSHSKINRVGVKVEKETPPDEQPSSDFIQETIKQFGSDRYMSLHINEQDDYFKQKYEISIFESNGDQIHELKLPLEMRRKEIHQLIELLEILKIPYQTNDKILKVISNQHRKTLTHKVQAQAYLWAIDNNFSPILYSSSFRMDEEGIERDTTLTEYMKKDIFTDQPNLTRIECTHIEKHRPYTPLTQEDISHMEKFATENLGIKFNDKKWKIYYYNIQPKEKPKRSDGQNTTKIVE